MTRFSAREIGGAIAVALWGALLGAIPFPGASIGFFVAALIGPPVAFLILSKRPFLSWQICMIAAAFASAVVERNPQDPNDSIWVPALLGWVAFSAFSSPWPFILARHTERAQQHPDASPRVATYIGAGLLVFIACGLIIVGSITAVIGIIRPMPASQATLLDRVFPFIGWVMASCGIGLAVQLCRRTGELRLSKSLEDLFGLLLGLVSFTLGQATFWDMFDKTPCMVGTEPCARGSDEFWSLLVVLESIGVLVWIIRRGRREKTAKV